MFKKRSLAINSIYSGQLLFPYTTLSQIQWGRKKV